jgi:hypothetical protein
MNGRRLVGAGVVAALHVAIIAALLALSHERIVVPRAAPSGELIWFLPPPPKKIVAPVKPDAAPQPRATLSAPRNPLPDYRGITIPDAPPAAAAAPSLGGLHGTLFGCADLDKLSPEERVRCGSALAVPDNAVDFHDGVNRSRSAALWERGRLRKNAPLLLPCMNPNGFSPLATALCLAKSAATGELKPDEQPSYADPHTVLHLPNNGDPPDKPTGF